MPEPRKPASIDPRAASLLDWMGAQPWAEKIVLGGALALKHYLDYRDTRDCDAWWVGRVDEVERRAILDQIEEAMRRLHPDAEVGRRSWGDVDSIELFGAGKGKFSFQIAARAVQLAPYLAASWGGLQIESLEDNAASKMSALAGRGAPRDFVDVHRLSRDLGWTRERLWELWARKNPGQRADEARGLVRVHLEGLAARRPLDRIPPEQRAAAQSLREWFFDYFLSDAPGD